MLIRIFIRSNIISGAIFKILFRSFYAEILALQGFPAGLRDSYFIRDNLGKEIHPRPCTHHAELIRQVAGLCNNANQLAHRANSTGVAGQQSVDEMMRVAKEVWREIKENY